MKDFDLDNNKRFWHSLIVNTEPNKVIKCYVSDISYESALIEKKLLDVYGYDDGEGYATQAYHWKYAIPVSVEPIMYEDY